VPRLNAFTKASIAILLLGIIAVAVKIRFFSPYQATFVIVSDAEISEVQLEYEGRPVNRAFFSFPVDRVFAWDTTLAPGARPRPFVEVTWRGPDGRRHRVYEIAVHEDLEAPRCVHILRVDAAGNPVPTGRMNGSHPDLVESLCR